MCAERTEDVSQATLRDAIAGIQSFIKDIVTTMVTQEGHNGTSRTDNRLEAMLQDIVNKVTDDKLRLVEFESRLLRKIGDATSIPRHVKSMTGAMSDNQNFIGPAGDDYREERSRVGLTHQKKREVRR